jgi:DNA-binding IclR family transcriptional regulator
MIQMNKKWDRMLELFFENPGEKFSVRTIAKRTGISSSSVQRYLVMMKDRGLI